MTTQVVTEIHAVGRSRAVTPYLPYLSAVGIVAAAWLLYHLHSPVPKFPLDDPYITLHSAQVLHWGFDPNFPGVSPLYGATSAPFLGLVYLLLFFLQPLRALETACWLGILAYVLGLVYLSRVLKLSRFASFAIIALGLTSSFVPIHLLNGMETPWALAAIIWTLALGSARRFMLASFVAGVAAAIRPDLLTFAIFVLAAFVYIQPHQRAQFSYRALPLLLLPVLLCAWWYLLQTGHPFPLTALAKSYWIGSGQLPASWKIYMEFSSVRGFAISCGPLLLAAAFAFKDPIVKACAAYELCLLVAVYHQFPDVLFWNRYRYAVLAVPMLVYALALVVRSGRARTLLPVALAYSLLVAITLGIPLYLEECRYYDGALRATARWCEGNLPPDSRIIIQDAGFISFSTHFRIIDAVGLKTPRAIELNHQYTWPSAGMNHAEAISILARETHATHFITLTERSEIAHLAEQLQALGWRVKFLNSFGLYSIYSLEPPDSSTLAHE